MKQLLIWVLDAAARILGVITVPLRFILKLVLPATGSEYTGEVNQPSSQEMGEGEMQSGPPGPEKQIFPAISEPRMLGREKPIKPAAEVKPGWFSLPIEFLPPPTYWPVVLGLGIVFGVFGVVTNFIFSIVGIVLFILGIIGWIGDMWNEQPE